MSLLVTPVLAEAGKVRNVAQVLCVDCGGAMVLGGALSKFSRLLTALDAVHVCPVFPVDTATGHRVDCEAHRTRLDPDCTCRKF